MNGRKPVIRPVSYSSKKLNKHSRPYLNITKGALGILLAAKHFDVHVSHSGLRGCDIHIPVLLRFHSPVSQPPEVCRTHFSLLVFAALQVSQSISFLHQQINASLSKATYPPDSDYHAPLHDAVFVTGFN